MTAAPASPEAQAKLKEHGIAAPLHNSGHPKWNDQTKEWLDRTLKELKELYHDKDKSEFDDAARKAFEDYLDGLRQKLPKLKRFLQNDSRGLVADG